MDAILMQYHKVFDEDGTVKNCTREECLKLIELLEDKFPEESFGSMKTGFMETNKIKEMIAKAY
jgi:hypothetical protein